MPLIRLLGSVRVDVPVAHHVKGATEVVVLRKDCRRASIWHVYPDPNHHVKRYPGHHEHGREMLEFPRLALSSRLVKLSYVDCISSHGRTAGSTTASTALPTSLSTSPTSTSPTASSPPLSTPSTSPPSPASPSSTAAAAE